MTLIALMSVGVISLVVWLIVLFLSVTEGIERSWLEKLTSLNAPVKITPTPKYYSSYYYLADSISSSSNYAARSLKEKIIGPSDPHNPEVDETIPAYWAEPEKNPDGSLRDPVKIAYGILSEMKKSHPDLAFQDFEISGAMLRVEMVRPSPMGGDSHSFLTQASYLASFPDQNPYIKNLLIPPTAKDINNLLLSSAFKEILPHVDIKTVKTASTWRIPLNLLPENTSLPASATLRGKEIKRFDLASNEGIEKGTLKRVGQKLFWNNQEVFEFIPVYAKEVTFQAELIKTSIAAAQKVDDLKLKVQGKLGNIPLQGNISWHGLEIASADIKTSFKDAPTTTPLWVHGVQQKLTLPILSSKDRGVLLPKHFYDNGVRIGDKGYLSYPAATAGALQEQRLLVFVAGFYDPGVIAIGNKCILAPPSIVHLINKTSQVEHFDRGNSAGFALWIQEIKNAPQLAKEIQKKFHDANIADYWKISTYRDFEFSKDLLQQFQSDKYLFTLIGLIILLVACCNIISLLVILVNDKKQEIGILQALGASRKSIAFIFGGVGAALGILSSFIGVGAAMLTLKNLDKLVQFLSFLQGHQAFNSVFYGAFLPHTFSYQALVFVLILTPILSLGAGLIPAWKACRLSPSQILRSE